MAPMTRGDILRYSLAFALRRAAKIVRGLPQGLSEDERFAVADHVVAQLKESGDPSHWGEESKAEMWADYPSGCNSSVRVRM